MDTTSSRQATSPSGPMKASQWDSLRLRVLDSRALQKAMGSQAPHSFHFRRGPGRQHRLYWLGVKPMQKEYMLMCGDVSVETPASDTPAALSSEGVPMMRYRPLVQEAAEPAFSRELSAEEQLARERQRIVSHGVTSYKVHDERGRILFSQGGNMCICDDLMCQSDPVPATVVKTSCKGAKMDPKMCPSNADLVAFVHKDDLWVCNHGAGTEARLTTSNTSAGSTRTSGVAGYIVQEEFDRYTGYWWQPASNTSGKVGSQTYRVLYEEIDDSQVDVIKIYSPSSGESCVEDFRYPRPNTNNSVVELRMAQFTVDANTGQFVHCEVRKMESSLKTLYPWMEYIVRAGWTEGGTYCWAQILNREQTRSALVVIPPEYFLPADSATPSGHRVKTFLEEESSVWINVHDACAFLQSHHPDVIRLIWAGESTGFRHLYLYEGSLSAGSDYKPPKCTTLTRGDWEVSTGPVQVDEVHEMVYFSGKKDSAIEDHRYVVSYGANGPQEPRRLTRLGYSHSVTLSQDCSLMLSSFSSVATNPSVVVYGLDTGSSVAEPVPVAAIVDMPDIDPRYKPPKLFEYTSREGNTHHAMVYEPHNRAPGQTYPVFLYVYGGPHVQCVVNKNMAGRLMRLHMYAAKGYAVAVIDGRGSSGRGLGFESPIKNKMGTVEIADQVEGLEWLAGQTGYMDLSRVCIHGWSYGGYLALMGLCQRPDFFKVAISGAPVTDWKYYDTAYTERYMGTPTSNEEGYNSGCVMTYASGFPDDDDRLLICHGLIDENVHYIHTRKLVDCLTQHCKPYRLQVYHGERHGIRQPETSCQFDTTMLSFLERNL